MCMYHTSDFENKAVRLLLVCYHFIGVIYGWMISKNNFWALPLKPQIFITGVVMCTTINFYPVGYSIVWMILCFLTFPWTLSGHIPVVRKWVQPLRTSEGLSSGNRHPWQWAKWSCQAAHGGGRRRATAHYWCEFLWKYGWGRTGNGTIAIVASAVSIHCRFACWWDTTCLRWGYLGCNNVGNNNTVI